MVLVYIKAGYLDTVNSCGKLSMLKATNDMKALPDYSTNGEVPHHIIYNNGSYSFCLFFQWVITDVRHNSTANAFHTTVPCLSGR